MERHRVIDLLPDRNAETVKVWLQGHPEIDVICPDRASRYADAARQAAPQAIQVADRFHFTKNVREKLKDLLDRNRSCLPVVEEGTVHSTPGAQEKEALGEAAMLEQEHNTSAVNEAVLDHSDDGGFSGPLTVPQWRRKVSREKRYALYEEARALRKQGLSHYAIAGSRAVPRTSLWS